jgi:hypothetical protein
MGVLLSLLCAGVGTGVEVFVGWDSAVAVGCVTGRLER